MTATDIRDYFSDPNIVAEIVRELNMEIGFCPILRNLKREKDCGVIDDESISFRELGAEDRNEVFVYLGRILESCLLYTSPSPRDYAASRMPSSA